MNIPICVAVVAMHPSNDELIAATSRRHDHSSWGLPGGKIEEQDGDVGLDLDQTLRRAAARELLEETGLEVGPDDLRWVYGGPCSDESGGGDPDSITVAYRVRCKESYLTRQEGEPPVRWSRREYLVECGAFSEYNRRVFDLERSLRGMGLD